MIYTTSSPIIVKGILMAAPCIKNKGRVALFWGWLTLQAVQSYK